MQLDGKVAILYGAAGSMGGAVTRAFGAEGARLFLAGRTLSKVRAITEEIESAGASVAASAVDVDDREAVERHAAEVVDAAGRIDVSFNAAGMDAVQNSTLAEMSVDDFMTPITEPHPSPASSRGPACGWRASEPTSPRRLIPVSRPGWTSRCSPTR